MELVDLADKTVANIATEQVIGGELSIGAGESVGMQRIMNITSDIMLDYPDVKIRLVSGNAEEIEAQLTKGILDFGVIMGERPLEQYNHLQLPEYDRWGIVMRKDDPLSRLEQIQPEDLKNRPLLVSEQAIQDHRFQSWWGNTGSAIPIVGTYTLIFNAKLLVKNNRIYLLTFEHLIEDSTSEALVFRPLKPEVTEPITVIWKKNTVQSKVAELFINRLKTNLKSLA